ncbi:MAG TPA: FtsL-like putative cell division protein [Candidatus Acidoferrales bacterium]|nr:FtsL-like putative cell division protein [Candidatus Acidoferrales bacterium]
MSDEIELKGKREDAARSADAKNPKQAPITVSKFILFLGGTVAVLLIIVNNSVTVDRLVREISSLDSAYREIRFRNDSLQAEMKKLSSAERITRIASEKLGLVYSSQTLDQVTVDADKLEEANRKDARDTTK